MIGLLTGRPGVGVSTKLVILLGLLVIAWGAAWVLQDLGETRVERDVAIQVNQANAEDLQETLDQLAAIRAREADLRVELDALHDELRRAEQLIMQMEEDWLDYPLRWRPTDPADDAQ